MLRVLKGRFARGRLTEQDPRGGKELAWLPTVQDPARLGTLTCPTSALDPKRPDRLDLGACIFCGGCGRDGVVSWERGVPNLGQREVPLVAGARPDELPALQQRLRALTGTFGRSLGVRHVSAGSCNGCEVEVQATTSPYVDLERFGIRYVASPRHADVLLVSGVVTQNLAAALARTYAATPDPKVVVAMGACGMTGGIFAASPHVLGGAAKVVPVDVVVPGCPPPPESLIAGLLEAGRILSNRSRPGPAKA